MPARRACKGYHIDVRVTCEGMANVGAVTADDVEDARRYACFVEEFREDERGKRRDLARLQHHYASDCKRWAHLACRRFGSAASSMA